MTRLRVSPPYDRLQHLSLTYGFSFVLGYCRNRCYYDLEIIFMDGSRISVQQHNTLHDAVTHLEEALAWLTR